MSLLCLLLHNNCQSKFKHMVVEWTLTGVMILGFCQTDLERESVFSVSFCGEWLMFAASQVWGTCTWATIVDSWWKSGCSHEIPRKMGLRANMCVAKADVWLETDMAQQQLFLFRHCSEMHLITASWRLWFSMLRNTNMSIALNAQLSGFEEFLNKSVLCFIRHENQLGQGKETKLCI